jgi:hypothetical protein
MDRGLQPVVSGALMNAEMRTLSITGKTITNSLRSYFCVDYPGFNDTKNLSF